jgi:hypothetical protein
MEEIAEFFDIYNDTSKNKTVSFYFLKIDPLKMQR